MSITYKEAGVNIESGNNFVKKITPLVKSTFSKKVITDIGGFGALFSGSFPEYQEPILVSGTDGVGTKLILAQKMKIHNTIGIDLVAMCVNDIITSGASPLFFLDYISCGQLNEETMVEIVKGITKGCRQADCSLIGGETAEHPNVMAENEYDLAGFAVGVVDKEKIINGQNIKPDDLLIGLPSSGIHSNGYSLVRKLFFELKKYPLDKTFPELTKPLGETLLTPTKIYTSSILKCLKANINLKGIIHITGGGFYENIPRILPKNIGVKIDKSSFIIPPIFKIIQAEGDISDQEMFTTFNMGIGMMLFIDPQEKDITIKTLLENGESPIVIGKAVKKQDKKVEIY
jgi:phosphoribosylformylglycinamidine cyclo-ligase